MNTEEQVAEYINKLPDVLYGVLEKWANLVRNSIIEKTPVRTGYLRANTRYNISNELELTVFNPTEYGPFVDQGTVFMRAQPFFFISIEQALPKLGEIADSDLQELGNMVFGS